ncbi:MULTISPECIES: ATP-binding protein [Streptomyces]|uniref:ATP-binding protein n=1 Tax=Streptomyces TaxID=1883 RepID=UPI001B369A62|nr:MULTISPECIES: ATP-binding protein [Streptomyces]MBQ0984860.1 ATP-binding protein [Streptomyces sp. F63]MCC3654279.1 ATP-binding protein [Streptomyces sp. S07_1.15]WSQ71304.1 ATP-binding protein [Streptomyces xinghaiensis]
MEPHTYALCCPPQITVPKIARDFVTSVLRSLDLRHITDSAALCTSELVTNSYVHTNRGGDSGSGIGSLLWLVIEPTLVRISVYDANPSAPAPRSARDDDEGGRGLALVAALADAWGHVRGGPPGLTARQGKGVWCELGTLRA